MRLRKTPDAPIPSTNLIPMLNVMLGILAFFVIVTMTLSTSQGVNVQLPARPDAPPPAEPTDEVPPPPLIVKLDGQGQILIDGNPIVSGQLEPQIQAYLGESEDGVVYLVADRQMPYEEVLQFLIDMKRIGGDRVSLALEES